jgi:hypothetical protein
MGASPSVFMKETAAAGPFSRRVWAHTAYEETKRISTYAGSDLIHRDSTAVFLDWDDTLFPSTWVQNMQRRGQETGKPLNIKSTPKMKVLCSRIVSFLSAASRVGHVFIVTAASHDFIRKCCRIFFPDLLKVLEDLQVTIIYARPHGDFEHQESFEQWKEAVFRRSLASPHERPLPPQLARFYGSTGWQNLISYGDQWTDHSALLKAAAAFEPQNLIKTLKAHCTERGLTPGELAEELRVVGSVLPSLAGLETGCSYDLDVPEIRCTFGLPTKFGDPTSPSSVQRGRFSRVVPSPVTPKSSRSTPRFHLSRNASLSSGSCGNDVETNPDYMEDMDLTPATSKNHWTICGEEL